MDFLTRKEFTMKPKRAIVLPLLMILFAWISLPANAEQKNAIKNIANVWIFIPKQGHVNDFTEAFKKHITFRKSMHDPRSWQVYTPNMGENMNTYIVRYCCDSWANLDDYEQWSTESKASQHWQKNVAKYVDRFEHHRSEVDFKNSNWASKLEYKYVGVTHYIIKQGHYSALNEDKKLLSDAAKKQNWPFNWSWSDSIDGKASMNLAIPYINYAAMTPPETKFSEILAKHLNSKKKAKKLLKRWSSHFDSTSYNVYEHRKDLSMK